MSQNETHQKTPSLAWPIPKPRKTPSLGQKSCDGRPSDSECDEKSQSQEERDSHRQIRPPKNVALSQSLQSRPSDIGLWVECPPAGPATESQLQREVGKLVDVLLKLLPREVSLSKGINNDLVLKCRELTRHIEGVIRKSMSEEYDLPSPGSHGALSEVDSKLDLEADGNQEVNGIRDRRSSWLQNSLRWNKSDSTKGRKSIFERGSNTIKRRTSKSETIHGPFTPIGRSPSGMRMEGIFQPAKLMSPEGTDMNSRFHLTQQSSVDESRSIRGEFACDSASSVESYEQASWNGSVDFDSFMGGVDDKGTLVRGKSSNYQPSEGGQMSKSAFLVAQELLDSERRYVNALSLVNYDFRVFITEKIEEDPNIMPLEEFEYIFTNMKEILEFNRDLLHDFKDRVENWRGKIADIFVKKGPFLKLYSTYLQNFPDASKAYETCLERYPRFRELVQEFESRETCGKLHISSYLLKPVQRLPQYKLFLERYVNKSSPESVDYLDATRACLIVSEAADHSNEMIRHDDNFRQLVRLQRRMDMHELVQADRGLIKEGPIKKQNRNGLDDIYLVLCTDLLIYARISPGVINPNIENDPLKVIYKIPLSTLTVQIADNSEEYPCDFNIKSSVRSCRLRAKTKLEKLEWIESIEKAMEDNSQRQASFSSAVVNFKRHSTDFRDNDFRGNDCPPVWIPDDSVTMCQVCFTDFHKLFKRRHHCRCCGRVLCHACSSNEAPLRYCQYRPQRVCDQCFQILKSNYDKDDSMRLYRGLFNGRKNSFVQLPNPSVLRKGRENGFEVNGHLHFKSTTTGKWRKNWFGLKEKALFMFKASDDPKPVSTLAILGFDLILDPEAGNELKNTFENGRAFQLEHSGTGPLTYFAESNADKWINALQDAINIESTPLTS